MSVRLGILAMVAQGPTYGYVLRAEFDRRTGTTTPLNIGQVYKTLEALERDGFVTRSTVTDAAGQVFYEITDAGRTEVAAWLGGDSARLPPSRSDVAIKIALATTLPGVDVGEVLRAQRASAIRHLQRLTRESHSAVPGTGDELARQLVSDAVLFEAEAEVRWLDHVTARIAQANAAGLELTIPLDSTPPKRGRPAGPARSRPRTPATEGAEK